MDLAFVPQNLPVGYTSRPTTLDDVEAVNTLWTFAETTDGFHYKSDPEGLRTSWSTPNYDLANSHRLVFAPNGELVATVRVNDTDEPPVLMRTGWAVHPQHRHIGIEEAIFAWAEERAKQSIVRCPPDVQVILISWAFEKDVFRRQVLENLGFTYLRNEYQMRIDMEIAPPMAQFPAGIALRPYCHPDDLHAVMAVREKAFEDHWDYVPLNIDNIVAEKLHEITHNQHFDPSLYFVAVDEATAQIVGVCLCDHEFEDEENASYVEDLGVLRDYRGRGIALALLNHAFGEIYKRGRKTVMLYVDTHSPTGALRLYERVGMRPFRLEHCYHKVLREGIALIKTD